MKPGEREPGNSRPGPGKDRGGPLAPSAPYFPPGSGANHPCRKIRKTPTPQDCQTGRLSPRPCSAPTARPPTTRRHLMRFLPPLMAVLVGLAALPARGDEPSYDLVVRNGTVVDGTGNPWFRGDVAVRGDRIVAVGRVPPGKAKREIDAKGLVVAPGFIDMHSHSDFLLLEDGDAQSKIRQGVTTEVLGEGSSAGPAQGQLPARRAKAGDKGLRWTTLGGYFDA